MRFPTSVALRLSPEMYEAIVKLAVENEQAIGSYCRAALLAHLRRERVKLRSKQQPNKQQAEGAAAQAAFNRAVMHQRRTTRGPNKQQPHKRGRADSELKLRSKNETV